jgi:molecular chaperone DnaK
MSQTYGLGVDLGTTYTAAALWRDGRAECVPLGISSLSVPSVLFLRDDDVLLVGDAAVRRGIVEPERLARQFKRRTGDDVPILLGDLQVTATELAGQLLRWVVDTVTDREGGPPAHVTLTHPAAWREHRTAQLVRAAETAGLTDVGLLPEPVAAAAFYSTTERLEPGPLLAVYDLGGGTFDATIVAKTPTGFAVRGEPLGDPDLGGTDFDQAVMDHVASVLGPAWRTLDLGDPAVAAGLAQVHQHAVAAKEALSADTEASIPVILPGLVREVRITRGEFESAVRIPLLRSVDMLAQAIEAAGVTPAAVHTALLVGGSSRIPLVARLISGQLGLEIGTDAHPKYAVCLGAAIAAGARLETVSPHMAPSPAPAPWIPPAAAAVPEPRPVADPSATPGRRPVPEAAAFPDTAFPDTARPTPWLAEPQPAAWAADRAPEWLPAAAGVADQSAPPPETVRVAVDLARTGITATVDRFVATEPGTPRWTPVVIARDEPLEVRHLGDRRRGVRTAILVGVAAVALVVALVLVAVLVRRGGG